MLSLKQPLVKSVVAACPAFCLAKASMCSITTIPFTPNTSSRRGDLWQTGGLKKGMRAPTERLLFQRLQEAYPNEQFVFNVRTLDIRHPETNSPLQIDASILRLGKHFEFQDPYHFTAAVQKSSRPLSEVKMLDEYKKKVITERGEDLLQMVPWWDGELDSLIATIQSEQPGSFTNYMPASPPVSKVAPNNFFEHYTLPHVGVLMRPIEYSPRYFATSSTWLMGIKYDGTRFLWNPKEQKLYSRYGNELRFPDELKKLMPNKFIEGEAWFGPGTFNETAKLKSTSTMPVNWATLRLIVFDMPPEQGSNDQRSYEERYTEILEIVPSDHPFLVSYKVTTAFTYDFPFDVTVPPRIIVNSVNQLKEFQKMVIEEGEEGLVIMKPRVPYEQGFSASVLKLKPRRDVDALVISCENNFAVLEQLDEARFKALLPNNLQLHPGEIVTYTFKRFVSGTTLPHKPKIIRIRNDVDWEKEKAATASHAIHLGRVEDYTNRWDKDIDTVRSWFIQYAKLRNFDPLVASEWYKVKQREVCKMKGAHSMLKWYNGSVIKALVEAFPEIALDKSKFSSVPKHHWKDVKYLRRIYEEYAEQKGFDPLVADNWYTVKQSDIVALKPSSLKYFQRSHIKGLIAAFPEIGLDESKFSTKINWKKIQNVRKMFDEFAAQKGFDPLVANNWYNVKWRDILVFKKTSALRHFQQSHIKAIIVAYPDIGLDASKFHSSKTSITKTYLKDPGFTQPL